MIPSRLIILLGSLLLTCAAHKIFLQNPPAGVEVLSVSHGFNVLTVKRAFE
jgi:hypothetical protein